MLMLFFPSHLYFYFILFTSLPFLSESRQNNSVSSNIDGQSKKNTLVKIVKLLKYPCLKMLWRYLLSNIYCMLAGWLAISEPAIGCKWEMFYITKSSYCVVVFFVFFVLCVKSLLFMLHWFYFGFSKLLPTDIQRRFHFISIGLFLSFQLFYSARVMSDI